MATPNPFASGGGDYAHYRPGYPPALADWVAGLCPGRALAADIGCGSGQFSRVLAQRFDKVHAFDPSASQIENATLDPRIAYAIGGAERIALPDACADLIAAAQAAHWFDHGLFLTECARVARPGGVVALLTYGVPRLDGPAAAAFDRFYWSGIHAFWPPERAHVENGYADLPFPFDEVEIPQIDIALEMPLEALIGYIGTWSAVRAARRDADNDPAGPGLQDIVAAWGDPAQTFTMHWPVGGRVGIR